MKRFNKLITLMGIGLIVIGVIGLLGQKIFNTVFPQKTENKTVIVPSPTLPSQQVNYFASFAIYTNGTLRIFTDSKYHNVSKDVFIDSSNPNIVKVKKTGTTWGDFFNTLPMKLTDTCLTTGTNQTFCTGEKGMLKFYLNGFPSPNALHQIINQGDKLLVSFGSDTDSAIPSQLQSIPNP